MMSLIYSQLSVVYSSSGDLEVLLWKSFLAQGHKAYSPVFSHELPQWPSSKESAGDAEPLQEPGFEPLDQEESPEVGNGNLALSILAWEIVWTEELVVYRP